MKKFILLFSLILLLSACSNSNKDTYTSSKNKNLDIQAISTGADKGILVGVSDPHIYSKKGPLLISGSYYFNPRNFYLTNGDISYILKSYSSSFNNKPVFYYDESNGAQAGIVVYVLRNILNKRNVSLLISPQIKQNLKYNQKSYSIKNLLTDKLVFTGGYIGTGKYVVAYNPSKIKFLSGDLLLYSSDIGTMKEDYFYNNLTGVDIKSFDWSKLIDIDGSLKSQKEIKTLLKPLELDKYKRVYIYYPKYWYRSGVLALYLQENF